MYRKFEGSTFAGSGLTGSLKVVSRYRTHPVNDLSSLANLLPLSACTSMCVQLEGVQLVGCAVGSGASSQGVQLVGCAVGRVCSCQWGQLSRCAVGRVCSW